MTIGSIPIFRSPSYNVVTSLLECTAESDQDERLSSAALPDEAATTSLFMYDAARLPKELAAAAAAEATEAEDEGGNGGTVPFPPSRLVSSTVDGGGRLEKV